MSENTHKNNRDKIVRIVIIRCLFCGLLIIYNLPDVVETSLSFLWFILYYVKRIFYNMILNYKSVVNNIFSQKKTITVHWQSQQ